MFSVFAMDRVVNTLFDIWYLLHIQPEDCQMNIIRPKFPLKKCYNFHVFVNQLFFIYLTLNFSYNIIVNFPKQLPHYQIFWLSYLFKFIASYWWINYFNMVIVYFFLHFSSVNSENELLGVFYHEFNEVWSSLQHVHEWSGMQLLFWLCQYLTNFHLPYYFFEAVDCPLSLLRNHYQYLEIPTQ